MAADWTVWVIHVDGIGSFSDETDEIQVSGQTSPLMLSLSQAGHQV